MRRQPNLVRFDVRFVFGNKSERALDARIRDDAFNLLAHYLISNVTELDSIGGLGCNDTDHGVLPGLNKIEIVVTVVPRDFERPVLAGTNCFLP